MSKNLSDLTGPNEPIVRTLGGLPVHSVSASPGNDYLKALFYGPSGVGKSVLAASASEVEALSPVVFLNSDKGTRSVAEFYPNVVEVRINKFMEFQAIFEDLRKGHSEFKTVIVDSVTEDHRLSMDKIMTDTVDKFPERDIEVPAQREWGKAGEQVRKLIRAYRDLPMNVIFIALEGIEQDKEQNIKAIGPALPGKLLKEVPGYVDIVGRMYTKTITREGKDIVVRGLYCANRDKAIGKDRTNSIPIPLVDPTMAKIYGHFVGTNKNNQPNETKETK